MILPNEKRLYPKQLPVIAATLRGFVEGSKSAGVDPVVFGSLQDAALWLDKLSRVPICRDGYIGCTGGETCSSDHK